MFSFMKSGWWKVTAALILVACAVCYITDFLSVKAIVGTLVGTGGVLMAIPAVVAPFPVDPELTSVAVAYKNEAFIADEVFPIVPVGLQNFKYKKWALADGFTIPDTKVGRTSQPNRVEFGFTEDDSSCLAFGLDEPVPQDDIDNAPAGYNPLARATMSVTDLVLLDREKRCADLVFNTASYNAANREALSGTGQFSDYTNSNPVDKLLRVMDGLIMRPNIVIFGNSVWTTVRQHPRVVSSILGNSGQQGVIDKEQLASKLEVDKILVGKGWYNSAKKGQTVSMSRMWGNFIALIYQDAMADTRGRVTFGFTAKWGSNIAGSVPDKSIGLKGGQLVRSGMYVRELVTAGDLGYLLSNVIA